MAAENDVTLFVCPMHNHIQMKHSDHCPICGMKLIPQETRLEKNHTMQLSTQIDNTLKILTENVRKINLQEEFYTGYRLKQVQTPITEFTIELLLAQKQKLKVGDNIEAYVTEYIWGKRTWHGEITAIFKNNKTSEKPIDKNNKIISLEGESPDYHYATIRLKTPYNILKPNMYLSIILYAENTPALVIPFKSVFFNVDNSHSVIKKVADNYYQKIAVKVGRRQDHLIEVLSGLKLQDQVVTEGHFLLYAEQRLTENNPSSRIDNMLNKGSKK